MSSPSADVTPWQRMASACSGAVLTSLLMTPFDVVKTRLQIQSALPPLSSSSPTYTTRLAQCCREALSATSSLGSNFVCQLKGSPMYRVQVREGVLDCAVDEISSQRFRGTWDGVTKIVRYEGARSLWKGLSPALLMSAPSTMVYFVGYDYLRDELRARLAPGEGREYVPLIAGGVARTVAATIISPLELIRTRMQSTMGVGGFQIVMEGVGNMLRTNGVGSLWRGLPVTLWRDVPFSAIYWMGVERIRDYLVRNHSSASIDSMHSRPRFTLNEFEIGFLSGAGSGMIAATLTTPFDVAKTMRQVGNSDPAGGYWMAGLMLKIFREEGASGLFRGLVPRIVKVAPSCAIMISSYELGKRFFAANANGMTADDGAKAILVEEL